MSVTVRQACREDLPDIIAIEEASYGEILLRTAMEALFREGCTSFFLEVRQSNAPAQGLYRKLGYEALAVRKDYYSQPVEDACIMHCQKEKYQWRGHSL